MIRMRAAFFSAAAFCALVLVAGASGQVEDKKAGADKSKSATGDKTDKSSGLDKLKAPPQTSVVMTWEKYQELLDRITQLEKQLKPDRLVPRYCKVTGTVEGEFLELQAEMHIEGGERSAHFLGFRDGQLLDARIRPAKGGDDQQPLLDAAGDGYQLVLEKSGAYLLTIKAKAPIASAIGGERIVDLNLPGAPVTTLSIDLAHPVRELLWNKTVEKLGPGQDRRQLWALSVGKAQTLMVAWKAPMGPAGVGPLRTVRGQITVKVEDLPGPNSKVEDQQIVTTAELTLTDLRGQARDWKLWLPAQAKLKVISPEDVPISVSGPVNQIYTLTANGPALESLKVLATMRQSRGAGKVLIGPFTVLDAFKQDGTIEVKASPNARRATRISFNTVGDIEKQGPAGESTGADTLAVFRYGSLPTPVKLPKGKPAFGISSPLELDFQAATGRVDTTVDHALKLRSTDAGVQIAVTTRIQAKPQRTSIDSLDILLPRSRPESPALLAWASPPLAQPWGWLNVGGWGEWNIANGAPAAELEFSTSPNPRKARLKLAQYQSKEFTVVLTNTYYLPLGSQQVQLELPALVGVFDRGAKIKIETDDTLELLNRELGSVLVSADLHSLSMTLDRPQVDLAWRPFRPELAALAVADLTVRQGFIQVRQAVELRDPNNRETGVVLPILKKLGPLQLRVPAAARGFKVAAGGQLISLDHTKRLALVQPLLVPGRETLVLEYDLLLPRHDEGLDPPIEIHLVWLEQATRVESKVRFWSDLGVLPTLAENPAGDASWRDLGVEVVKDRDRLPVKVFQAEGGNVPLPVHIGPAPPVLTGALADRALIQVKVDEEGSEVYRARFRLTKLNVSELDIQLPAPVSGLFLQVTLDGKKMSWRPLQAGGRIARLALEPSLYTGPVVLEVSYQLPRGQPEAEGLWQTALHAPSLQGQAFVGQIRWQVTMPSHWVPVLADDDGSVEQHWAWRGWLFVPEPSATSADLERWLTNRESNEPVTLPSLVCDRATLEPLRLLRMPRPGWLVLCSGLLLTVGLGLYFAPLSPGVFWSGVAVCVGGLFLGAILWPAVFPAILFGCQPGAVVLAAILGLQWTMQERYRRRVLFMPSFTRLKQGSSLHRSAGPLRVREASTIDAPAHVEEPASGSAVNKP